MNYNLRSRKQEEVSYKGINERKNVRNRANSDELAFFTVLFAINYEYRDILSQESIQNNRFRSRPKVSVNLHAGKTEPNTLFRNLNRCIRCFVSD